MYIFPSSGVPQPPFCRRRVVTWFFLVSFVFHSFFFSTPKMSQKSSDTTEEHRAVK